MRQSIILLTLVFLLASTAQCQISEESKNFFRQAMEMNKSREYGTALNYFMKAYKLSPDILAEDDQGLLDNATSFLKAKVDQDPSSAETHFQLAELLILRGINDDGMNHYKKGCRTCSIGSSCRLGSGRNRPVEAIPIVEQWRQWLFFLWKY